MLPGTYAAPVRVLGFAAFRPALSLYSSATRFSRARAVPARSLSSTSRLAAAATATRARKPAASAAAKKKPAAKKTTPKRATSTTRATGRGTTRAGGAKAAKTRVKAKPKAKVKAKPKRTTTTRAKKPAAKAKKVKKVKAKKPVVKKKAVLTPEQKARKEVILLKKVANFTEPKSLPDNTWSLFVSRNLKGFDGAKQGEFALRVSGMSDVFKAMTTVEAEKLRAEAEQNKLLNHAAYKTWVETMPIADVLLSNKARRRLNRKFGFKYHTINDDRIPKAPRNGFNFFFMSKMASGDIAKGPVTVMGRAAGVAWKALSEEQKKPYFDLEHAERLKYASVMTKLRDDQI